ncbi:uncharacterized protein ATNIH1004_001999 [Aspergillus tanneri]|uniref:Class II aldolase/adducin N-terminal domain-containing protein n=1 Tax=Aspergillus tanneri TaxID=1220188 RepID=A0A5M9M3R1_9EURO|nr:uncharacterized protein ATNIH1004_001999 [Aspergillus tanneri]KAA8641331.1 hypothetical protein ATNIH1004_001999 [Aspergillus tanneri]
MSTTTITQPARHTIVAEDTIPQQRTAPSSRLLARGDQHGKLKLRGIPSFDDPYAKRQWVREHMAGRFDFSENRDTVRGVSGHISVRDPVLPGHFWMNPFAKHFSLIKASDLVLVDANGYVVERWEPGHYQRGWLTRMGFMGRRGVHLGSQLEMITQDACNFYGKLSVYEEHGGIALAQDEGKRLPMR